MAEGSGGSADAELAKKEEAAVVKRDFISEEYRKWEEAVCKLIETGSADESPTDFARYMDAALTFSASAIWSYRGKLTELLVKGKGNLQHTEFFSWTALHYAARLGNVPICRLLLDKGLSPHKQNDCGRTPLLTLCRQPYRDGLACQSDKAHSRDTEVAELLLSRGADINVCDEDGHTALMFAVVCGDQNMTQFLLEKGADISVKTLSDQTAMGYALLSSNTDIVKLLATHGASIEEVQPSPTNAQQEKSSRTKHLSGLKAAMGRAPSPASSSYARDAYESLNPYGAYVQAKVHVAINFLGDSEAGKTSMANSLSSGVPQPNRRGAFTVGVEVHTVRHGDYEFQIFDFGGHRCYHLAHQMYLFPSAVNVLFLKTESKALRKKSYAEQIQRWLSMIAAKVPNAVVLLVLAKSDLLSEQEIALAKDDIRQEAEKFKSLRINVITKWAENLKKGLQVSTGVFTSSEEHSTTLENIDKAHEEAKDSLVIWPILVQTSCEASNATGFIEVLAELARATFAVSRHKELMMETVPKAWQDLRNRVVAYRKSGQFAMKISTFTELATAAGVPSENVKTCLLFFKITGLVLHFETAAVRESENIVFHDPNQLLRVLGNLVHHDIRGLLGDYSRLQTPEEQEEIEYLLTTEGLLPRDFVREHILKNCCSLEGEKSLNNDLIGVVMSLCEHFGLLIPVLKQEHAEPLHYFFPSLVERNKESVLNELSHYWPPEPEDQTQFDFSMVIQGESLPAGFWEKLHVLLSKHSKTKLVWQDGCYAAGIEADILIQESRSETTCSLLFEVRIPTDGGTTATLDMTWLYWVCMQTLSHYPGVLASIVTLCKRCRKHLFNVKDCLNQTADQLATMKCSKCPRRFNRTAADVFPSRARAVKKSPKVPALLKKMSRAIMHGDHESSSTGKTRSPSDQGGNPGQPTHATLHKHAMVMDKFCDSITEEETVRLIFFLSNKGVLSRALQGGRDIVTGLGALIECGFIAEGDYSNLYDALIDCKLRIAADCLKKEALLHFQKL